MEQKKEVMIVMSDKWAQKRRKGTEHRPVKAATLVAVGMERERRTDGIFQRKIRNW